MNDRYMVGESLQWRDRIERGRKREVLHDLRVCNSQVATKTDRNCHMLLLQGFAPKCIYEYLQEFYITYI